MNSVSIGRIVHYKDGVGDFPAIVTRVWDVSSQCVNLTVFGIDGAPSQSRTSVLPGDAVGNWHWPEIVK